MDEHCIEAVELLYHYLDGELTDERRVLIQHHLDDCPPCFEAFDFEAELRIVVRQKCRDQVPESLRAAGRRRPARSRGRTRNSGPLGRLAWTCPKDLSPPTRSRGTTGRRRRTRPAGVSSDRVRNHPVHLQRRAVLLPARAHGRPPGARQEDRLSRPSVDAKGSANIRGTEIGIRRACAWSPDSSRAGRAVHGAGPRQRATTAPTRC